MKWAKRLAKLFVLTVAVFMFQWGYDIDLLPNWRAVVGVFGAVGIITMLGGTD